MSDFVEIGHAIITCPRCRTPRHVPVGARCVPFADNTTKAFRAVMNGEQVGEIHLQIKHLPDGHRCQWKPPERTLRPVRPAPGEETPGARHA